MDGGRVLRALLAMRLGRRRATAIAANVGQGMAILFGIFGFFYNPEAGVVEMQSALAGLRLRDAMMTRFRTLAAHDTLGKAVEELLAGSQQDFPVIENDQPTVPVVAGGRIVGLLTLENISEMIMVNAAVAGGQTG